MERALLKIVKKLPVDNNGHYRWYAAYCSSPPKTKMRAPMFHLDTSTIKTEKDLCKLIYNNYGTGEFRVMAWRKGHKGMWTFWIGEITEEGFFFRLRKSDTSKSIDKLKEQLATAKDDDEREFILQDIEFEKEFKDAAKSSGVSYGFAPYIKSSGKRGTFIRWEDPDYNEVGENKLENWRNEEQIVKKVEKGEIDEWGILKQGRKEVAETFEKW